jgi:hypothetical protein
MNASSLRLLSVLALACLAAGGFRPAAQNSGLGFSFTNVAQKAGLSARTVYGGRDTNTYLLETTGTGVAALDYDGDGWADIFLVNGTVLEGFPKDQEPSNHLYRNRGDGTFEDVTARAGLTASGWGQGACVGDYDNDGREDLFVTTGGGIVCITTRAMEHSRTCRRPPASPETALGGAPGAHSSTTTVTAGSI